MTSNAIREIREASVDELLARRHRRVTLGMKSAVVGWDGNTPRLRVLVLLREAQNDPGPYWCAFFERTRVELVVDSSLVEGRDPALDLPCVLSVEQGSVVWGGRNAVRQFSFRLEPGFGGDEEASRWTRIVVSELRARHSVTLRARTEDEVERFSRIDRIRRSGKVPEVVALALQFPGSRTPIEIGNEAFLRSGASS